MPFRKNIVVFCFWFLGLGAGGGGGPGKQDNKVLSIVECFRERAKLRLYIHWGGGVSFFKKQLSGNRKWWRIFAIPSEGVLRTTGVVVQLVRIRACHARGRGFESRPFRTKASSKSEAFLLYGVFCLHY